MRRLAILISNVGTGTNLQAIIDAVKQKKIQAEISIVISDSKDAYGLTRARKHNLPIALCPRKEDLLKLLKKNNPDYICLAGWKQIIVDDIITMFSNQILNIHPGLIPDEIDETVKNPDRIDALWNKGKLTDKAIHNFIDQKSTYAGSSIHFLTHEFDYGPVLGRTFEKVQKNDTIDSLYARLKKKENKLYVDVLKKLCK